MNSRQRGAQGRIEFAQRIGLTPVEEGIPSQARLMKSFKENPIVAHIPESSFVIPTVSRGTSRSKKGKK